MSDWKLAMVAIVPLLLAAGWPGAISSGRDLHHALLGPRLRTWAALMLAAVLAGLPQPGSWLFYLGVDAVMAAVVLLPPRSFWQRAIGMLFVGMMGSHLSFGLFCDPAHGAGYAWFNQALGWVQWACLLAWGLGDVAGKLAARRDRPGRAVRRMAAVESRR